MEKIKNEIKQIIKTIVTKEVTNNISVKKAGIKCVEGWNYSAYIAKSNKTKLIYTILFDNVQKNFKGKFNSGGYIRIKGWDIASIHKDNKTFEILEKPTSCKGEYRNYKSWGELLKQ